MNTVSTRQGQLDGQLVVTDNQGKHSQYKARKLDDQLVVTDNQGEHSQYKAGTIRRPTGCNR